MPNPLFWFHAFNWSVYSQVWDLCACTLFCGGSTVHREFIEGYSLKFQMVLTVFFSQNLSKNPTNFSPWTGILSSTNCQSKNILLGRLCWGDCIPWVYLFRFWFRCQHQREIILCRFWARQLYSISCWKFCTPRHTLPPPATPFLRTTPQVISI